LTLSSEIERIKTVYDELNSLFACLISDGKEDPDINIVMEHIRTCVLFYDKDLPTP